MFIVALTSDLESGLDVLIVIVTSSEVEAIEQIQSGGRKSCCRHRMLPRWEWSAPPLPKIL